MVRMLEVIDGFIVKVMVMIRVLSLMLWFSEWVG